MKVEDIKRVAVVGAGIMGRGISQVCAQAGYQVMMTSRREETLNGALDNIESNLETLIRNQVVTEEQAKATLSRVKCTLNLGEAVRDADYVIEAVKEDKDLKKKLFQDFDEQCPQQTVLATNTSSLSVTELASATRREDKFIGMHWWNPAYLMPLVEIVKGAKTSEETVEVTKAFAYVLRKVPVVCRDSPGFIGVRLHGALIVEAISILEQGLASAEDIDTTIKMTLGYRFPVIGPLETVDIGGLDTFLNVYDYLHRTLGDRFRPPDLLRQNVKEGRLGLKTGKGFHEYTVRSAQALVDRRDEWILRRLRESKR
jgi:3-hydroxybutyryl-CoA dehydrogenase